MPSLTPDYTERLPALLSARTVSADSAATGALYDVVLSGLGFVFAIDSQHPYARESVAVQKQQIDTSPEAGEQSLDGDWIRSQTSWHRGAGADYYEPGNRDEVVPTRYRFKDSRGVNPWDRGKLSLHRKMDAVTTDSSGVSVVGGRWSGEDVWFSYDADGFYRHDSVGANLLSTPTAASPDQRIANAGSVILIGGAEGIKSVDPTTGVDTALCTQALGTVCTPHWAKGRIITTRGNALHQHSLAGGVIDPTSELFTHPDSSWVWTGVTEAPDAVLAAGHAGGRSAIYAFVLAEDSGGSVPKLGQPFQVAEMPPGEEIHAIDSYLGKYLGIGTTSGIRVAVLGQGGQVQYGPLLVETSSPVTSLGARGSFLYAAAGSSVIRVDLAESIDQDLRFPYAYDVEIPHDITSLAFDGVTSRVVVAADGHGTYAASETDCVTSGWLESGDIRYGTTAPKAFRTIDVSAETDGTNSVGVSATVSGVALPLVSLSSGKSGGGITLSSLPIPLEQMGYRLTLAGTTVSPIVEAVAVKAVPVPVRQRLIQYPVLIADEMRDAKNLAFGRPGYANLLLEALETLENSQSVVTVSDLTRPEQFEATIERVEFTRVNPRARGGRDNFGGVAKVTVRTL